MSFKTLKRRLGLWLAHNEPVMNIARIVNLTLFQWDKRQEDKSCGSLNPDVKFFVMRSYSKDQGLLSLYFSGLEHTFRCLHEGFVPIIDFQNYETQYNVNFPVNGTFNSWEYYFEQPSDYSLEEVYSSKNVRLSGWIYAKNSTPPPPSVITDDIFRDMMKLAPVKQYVRDVAQGIIEADGVRNMIGVIVRGTDYTKLHPAGHPVQPSPEMAAAKVDEFMTKYHAERIFLATEDKSVYDFFMNRYGDIVYTTDKNLISDYSGKDYLASAIEAENKYRFGLDYLVKMLCLSECKCLIYSGTSGGNFARIANNGRYLEEYKFELGRY